MFLPMMRMSQVLANQTADAFVIVEPRCVAITSMVEWVYRRGYLVLVDYDINGLVDCSYYRRLRLGDQLQCLCCMREFSCVYQKLPVLPVVHCLHSFASTTRIHPRSIDTPSTDSSERILSTLPLCLPHQKLGPPASRNPNNGSFR